MININTRVVIYQLFGFYQLLNLGDSSWVVKPAGIVQKGVEHIFGRICYCPNTFVLYSQEVITDHVFKEINKGLVEDKGIKDYYRSVEKAKLFKCYGFGKLFECFQRPREVPQLHRLLKTCFFSFRPCRW